MQICCDGDLYPKNRFQCCAGAVKPREDGGIRCCNHVGGSGPSSGPKYPMTEYQPLDGEKCCIGLNSFGKNFSSKYFFLIFKVCMHQVEKNVAVEKLSVKEKDVVEQVQKQLSTIPDSWGVAKHGHGQNHTIHLGKYVAEIELSKKAAM